MKLYVVVRDDLSPGLQCAQAAHAGFSFASEHPAEFRRWYTESNFIVVLAAKDLYQLFDYWARCSLLPFAVLVREPDCNNEPTAFAALGPQAGRLLSALPLALKERAMT